MTYFSTFSGVGGFEIALEALGHRCVGFSEIDAKAQSVYLHHFPNHRPYGDITAIDAASLPDFDLLVGGFPCQDLSVAGKRAGLAGKRSGLFFDVVRILEAKKPTWFILENVAGLLSSHGGRDMGTVLGELVDLGYGVAYRVLDSQNFGVPQRRRRVFLVGHLGDDRAGEVLALPEGMRGDSAASGEAREDAPADAGAGSPVCATGCLTHTLRAEGADASEDGTGRGTPIVTYGIDEERNAVEDGFGALKSHRSGGFYGAVAFNIRGRDGGAQAEVDADALANIRASQGGSSRTYVAAPIPILEAGARTGVSTDDPRAGIGVGQEGDPMFTLQHSKQHAVAFAENQRAEVIEKPIMDSLKTGGGKPGASYPAVRVAHFDTGTQSSRIHLGDVAPTLAAQASPNRGGSEGPRQLVGTVVRRLTPTECERLMSWPDGWTAMGNDGRPMSDSARYKMCGNGVVSAVVRAVAELLPAG